jgi:hypothetical protein
MTKKRVALFNDPAGGPLRQLVFEQASDTTFTVKGVRNPGDPEDAYLPVTIPGLITANTTGVADAPDKRFLTNAQLAALVTLTPLGVLATQVALAGAMAGANSLLASVAAVDMNKDAATGLYTVPIGKSCIITSVVLRNCSGNLTTASIAFGWTSPTFADVIATATHVGLTGSTLSEKVLAMAGALVGTAGQVFSVLDTIKQGGAMTITVDVYGYLF